MADRLADRFDLLRTAIGLFVVLGVALTALAGYTLLRTFAVTVSADVALSVLSGTSLVVLVVVLTVWLDRGAARRTGRRSV